MKAGVRERERNKALAAVVQVKARLEYSDYPNYSDILEFQFSRSILPLEM